METLIKAEALAAGYKSPVIKSISLNAHRGEILTLIGPNGSGKSTVLKTLAGETEKLGGAVYIQGERDETLGIKERAKKISLLMTDRVKENFMTCREVVETGRYPYTGRFGFLSETDKRAADEAMELVGTAGYSERLVSEISDGQLQRVMLAKAICQQPEILILDEPVSYLDIYNKIAFLDTLRKIVTKRRIAAVISMHELELAREISDYVICIKDGAVFKEGASEEIFTEGIIKELFNISEEMYKRYIKI